MPKLYFTDPGLAAHLAGVQGADDLIYHPLRGGLFESLIIAEFLKFRLNRGKESNLYFWRDNGISVGPDALTGTQYGQIMQRLPDGSGTSRSGRVAIRAKLL